MEKIFFFFVFCLSICAHAMMLPVGDPIPCALVGNKFGDSKNGKLSLLVDDKDDLHISIQGGITNDKIIVPISMTKDFFEKVKKSLEWSKKVAQTKLNAEKKLMPETQLADGSAIAMSFVSKDDGKTSAFFIFIASPKSRFGASFAALFPHQIRSLLTALNKVNATRKKIDEEKARTDDILN